MTSATLSRLRGSTCVITSGFGVSGGERAIPVALATSADETGDAADSRSRLAIKAVRRTAMADLVEWLPHFSRWRRAIR
ncbi:hypothetical protein [Burkholderia sp. SCN-KJ]|uniref:hypothetical protein n=1 Tax=Burkholderia sp. SCN-KJ TaxID=2969248 RepID=UPI00214F8E13|nr:hypothetical protein [Burkholderia sp. SCN-KJ]MCR4466831.1 hypothetical protein [Burkholderia sp. SCN-KJ]